MGLPTRQHAAWTADGHALGLFRIEAGSPPGGGPRPPVLLLPGMGANRFTFSVTPGVGLPWRLSEAGWDVWLGELRGARSSSAPPDGRSRWTPAAKLEHDLPALISAVRGACGGARLALVGHSLGGLLSLLHAGRSPDGGRSALLAVVTLCAPSFERDPPRRGPLAALTRAVVGLGLSGPPRGRLALPVGPVAAATRLGAPLLAPRSHFLPGGCEAAVMRAYFSHAVEDVPAEEAAALLGWRLGGAPVLQGADDRARTGGSVEADLGGVRVPVLSIAADRDGVVPPSAAERAFRAIGSADKTWRMVGEAHGSQASYAHADLLLGRHAEEDVVAPLCAWLARFRGSSQKAPMS